MPRRKPVGWPKLMVAKRLKSGTGAYYWAPPTWARERGCPVRSESLGVDYGQAKRRCDEVLNPGFDAWRTGNSAEPIERLAADSFDWLVAVYKSSPRYRQLPQKTQRSYDAALRLVAKHGLKDGRLFGELPLANITPGAADRLFERLRERPGGGYRLRTAVLAMNVCRVAWRIAWRIKPNGIPVLNPFGKMGLSYDPKATRPVTHDELIAFVKAADAMGETSIGTAAMIAFYWLQREVDILSRLTWNHYRPANAPNIVQIFHRKSGQQVDLPLYDDDGTPLWPELMERLDTAPRHGTLVVTRDRKDRRQKIHLPWKEHYFRHRVADIRGAAGIAPEAKFMGLRHGGNTEGANADLTDAQLRALSGHKTAAMTILYAKETMNQRKIGARKRLRQRTKQDNLSE
jgi:hypothetical protein